MNFGYTIYQAERTMSRAEQRAVDTQRGELAAALSRLLRRNRPAATAIRAATMAAVPDCACELIAHVRDHAPAR